MRYSPKNHKWAVIQYGYCLFGVGRTAEAAKRDAIRWMEFERDGYTCLQGDGTLSDLENCLDNASNRVDGAIYLINDADEIKSYVENQ